MIPIDLEQLRIFVAVAERGGFTRAAESLYISHSTTSRAVSALEEHLGVRLLERTSRSQCLTEAGMLLLEKGRELLGDAMELAERVSSLKKI